MDENTQKNSALVEQAAAAAESLEEQARYLADAVSIFRLDERSQQGRPPSAKPSGHYSGGLGGAHNSQISTPHLQNLASHLPRGKEDKLDARYQVKQSGKSGGALEKIRAKHEEDDDKWEEF